jgi:hypothetical protein
VHLAGIAPQYEIGGEGEATIDFGFSSKNQAWAVELLRLGETQAVKDATGSSIDAEGVPWTARVLYSVAADPKQSTEGNGEFAGVPERGKAVMARASGY